MCFKKLVLPHPEEKSNYSQTMENVRISDFYDRWFLEWQVPAQYQLYWQLQIDIKLSIEIPYPAGVWTDESGVHMVVRPEYLNAGVIAHENAHNSYRLLTEEQKTEFEQLYNHLKLTDKWVQLVNREHPYSLVNTVEGHAEVYRFLGNQMPESLKKYYPKLF